MKILTSAQMREVDELSTERYGIPSLLLMENAGMHLYQALQDRWQDLASRRIAVVCGKGNNGGDGLVLARQLSQRGMTPEVFLLADAAEVAGDARVNLDIYRRSGGIVLEVTSLEAWSPIAGRLGQFDVIVDAILGTGIVKPVSGLYLRVVEDINHAPGFVLAVDLPSGMFSDSLRGGAPTVRADLTVTFTAPKVAHVLNEDQEAVGDLRIAPIGSPAELLNREDYFLNMMTAEQAASSLPERRAKHHKGDFGHVAIAAGSQGKAGAAGLAAQAALLTGSGLVTAYIPEVVQAVVAAFRPEIMTEGLRSVPEGSFAAHAADVLLERLQDKDAVGIGPGLTTHPEAIQFVHRVVRNARIPMVLDADALNAFQGRTEQLKSAHQQPLVLTPHPGEFARLTGQDVSHILEDKVNVARQFAMRHRLWLVLKSFRTLVAEPAGQVYVCPRGNRGMATAGMGDVLTGVLTSLLGILAARHGTEPTRVTEAVALGVYLHALAGDLAAAETGAEALTAGDVLAHLGSAYQELTQAES